ncbi:hypothetical protein [Streptomyces sp. NPDC051219]
MKLNTSAAAAGQQYGKAPSAQEPRDGGHEAVGVVEPREVTR